jgi:5-methylcytosine-specific restriction endonuclease McrA
MDEALTRLVWQRARSCCKYCQLPQAYSSLTFEIDHVIARKHGGPTVAGNLALTCFYCNSSKGPNIAGIDPRSRKVVRLFHPRRHKWSRHFRWDGSTLVGRTTEGRATIAVLNINDPEAVATRAFLIAANLFPPSP